MPRFVGSLGLLAALLASSANAMSIYNYLFEVRAYPPFASHSVRVAETEKDRIGDLSTQVDGVVCFLPTDEAWAKLPGAVDALVAEREGNVRYDMLLAACAAVPVEFTRDIDRLKTYAQGNGGVVDSAYGSTYTMGGPREVCEFLWSGSSYEIGRCARVIGEGAALDDGAIYFIDRLLLPEEVENSLMSIIEMRRRRRRA